MCVQIWTDLAIFPWPSLENPRSRDDFVWDNLLFHISVRLMDFLIVLRSRNDSEKCFPHIQKQTSKRVARVMDNCGPHGTDIMFSKEQVTIMNIPPNCTSRHQPRDLSIMAVWKVHERQIMLRLIAADLKNRTQRREKSANKPATTKGMA